MRRAPEALRLVNAGRESGMEPITEVELGRYYGDKDKGNLRIIHNERTLHPFQPYIIEATANQLDYFETVFDLQSGLSTVNQVWYWKELLTMISLVAAFVSIIPLGQLLLNKVPYFQVLVHPLPPA